MASVHQSKSQPSAVVLLSGGLDSSANLALAAVEGWRLHALNINYGQMASLPERAAAERLARAYGATFQTLSLPWLGSLGGSALTDMDRELPTPKTAELDDLKVVGESAKAVWVPNRNGVLIHVAAAVAEARGDSKILVGFNREEAATFPDNSSEFLASLNESFHFSTQGKVSVGCFTDRMDKRKIVEQLRKLSEPSFPFELLWSCYRSEEKPCGECESCRRLNRALES